MNRKQYEQFVADYLERIKSTIAKKGADYATNEDPFANLSLSEHLGLTSTEVAVFSRLLDKVSRIANYLKKGELQNESVKDSIQDLIGYGLLLAACVENTTAFENLDTATKIKELYRGGNPGFSNLNQKES